VATLAVYFDDSGTHEDSPIVVAGGYVTSVETWTAFSTSWQQFLADETALPANPHGLRVFHMTDFESSALDPHSPFRGWNRERKAAFMAKATALINSIAGPGRGCGVIVGVVVADLRRMLQFERPTRPYSFALLEAMKCVERWANENNHRDPILYYFDKVSDHAGETMAVMSEVERDLELSARFRYVSWSWSSKERDSALQAADVLAYEAWKEATNERRPHTIPVIPVRASLRALAPYIRYQPFFDDLAIRQWISALDDAEWLEQQRTNPPGPSENRNG
jgi:hypothetical protein